MDTETVELPMFWFIRDKTEFGQCFTIVLPHRIVIEPPVSFISAEVQDPDSWECNRRNGYE